MNKETQYSNTILIIGGGAAGIFAALRCKQANPEKRVLVLEKTNTLLAKVRISGGGRCNVTHSCFDIQRLIKQYPRGSRELYQAFHQFQPKDVVEWFLERHVPLKTEADGRMFPTTDSSETIIQCFLQEARAIGVEIHVQREVLDIVYTEDSRFCVDTGKETYEAAAILIATGSNRKIFSLLARLGHPIEDPVPSLFTLSIPQKSLRDLAGISMPHAKIQYGGFISEGAVLITHWGLSGPAILKLSAYAARELYTANYQVEISVCWDSTISPQYITETCNGMRATHGNQQIGSYNPFSIPKNFWKYLCDPIVTKKWAMLSKRDIQYITQRLTQDRYSTDAKGVYKDEFVTCGGVRRDSVDFKTMQSKYVPGLFFAGEVLDIDGVTGGFNFQNAWTTGWIAGTSLSNLKN